METRSPLATLTPSRQNSESGELTDFSKVAATDFGISAHSLLSFPKEKDKSRVGKLKASRRSTIGLRGSPDTNSLIRFRAAKQAMKTPPRTPWHLLASPQFSGSDSIKQKMAAFQRLMDADEDNLEQAVSPMKKEWEDDEGTVGCLSEDLQSGAQSNPDNKVNQLTQHIFFPPVTPPLSKRRRRATWGLCEEKIDEQPSDPPSTPQQEKKMSPEFKSPNTVLHLQSLQEGKIQTQKKNKVSSSTKKKRVCFGAPLSPEVFDKDLPPNTPLRKGATPPSSAKPRSSLLKTPRASAPSLPRPNFSSPESSGASPVLARSTHSSAESAEDFSENDKIAFPIMEEEYDSVPSDRKVNEQKTQICSGRQDRLGSVSCGLDVASLELPELELTISTHPDDDALQSSAETQQELQSDQQTQEEAQQQHLDTSFISKVKPSRGRKRKKQAENETQSLAKQPETRRSTRIAAATALDKMKKLSSKRQFGNKEVDRSLYGKRDYASKNPLLSPIIESAASNQAQPAANPECSPTPSSSIPQEKTILPRQIQSGCNSGPVASMLPTRPESSLTA